MAVTPSSSAAFIVVAYFVFILSPSCGLIVLVPCTITIYLPIVPSNLRVPDVIFYTPVELGLRKATVIEKDWMLAEEKGLTPPTWHGNDWIS
jgi:hypothetical protein